jgi:hypothetical protein
MHTIRQLRATPPTGVELPAERFKETDRRWRAEHARRVDEVDPERRARIWAARRARHVDRGGAETYRGLDIDEALTKLGPR